MDPDYDKKNKSDLANIIKTVEFQIGSIRKNRNKSCATEIKHQHGHFTKPKSTLNDNDTARL